MIHVDEQDLAEVSFQAMLQHHDTVVAYLRTLVEHAHKTAPAHVAGLELAVEFLEGAGAEMRRLGPERLKAIVESLR